MVGQEMAAINDLQIPMYMHFWFNCNTQFSIFLMNVNRNSYSLVYSFITYTSFYLIVSLKQRINLYLT